MAGIAFNNDVPPGVRVSAIEALWNRGFGKPPQEKQHQHTGADGGEVRIVIRDLMAERVAAERAKKA